MAGNTGNGYRAGAVKERTQVFNTKTGQFVKRDTVTGRFISTSDTKYKGVKEEKRSK
jgi:hypothetical protein